MDAASNVLTLALEMDIERQVRELREEQEKTSYDSPHAATVLSSSTPEEHQEYQCEGMLLEDVNFPKTYINMDVPWPPVKDEKN